MAENELKWCGIFKVLFETILSIADPITDILTLVEFYRADHKTWFGVGLTFIILPSLFFLIANWNFEGERGDEALELKECQSTVWKYIHVLVLGCNPLLPAWLKLQTLYCYLKELRLRETDEELEGLVVWSKFAVLIEAALESAPQFIIQLYAMAVQQKSVSIIQMVSLPVSFLSLAWASTVADDLLHGTGGDISFSVTDRGLSFVTHLIILSSRLFAVALFTVSYKWWITTVLIFHCTVITICDIVWVGTGQIFEGGNAFALVLLSCLHWLRDESSAIIYGEGVETDGEKPFRRLQLVSHVLFCDRKHHHDPVVLFQSFPPHLVLLASHHLRLFVCCSWSRNETYSLLFFI